MNEVRSIVVPQNRRSPLKSYWKSIVEIITKQLKLMVCLNTKDKVWKIMLKNSAESNDMNILQKGQDFITSFIYGFKFEDCLALVRIDGIYLETFHVSDVKQTLQGNHMNRAVGRICGFNGRIRKAIENSTRTRIVVADQTIHIMGSNERIKVTRRAICDLIMGSPPNKIFGKVRMHSARLDSLI